MVINMSISSIDASTIAPRSSEASGIIGREQHQFQHMGETAAASFEKNVEQQSQRTTEANKSGKEEYRFDGSGKNKYSGGRNKKKKKQPEEAPMAPKSDSSFDIMI